MTDLQGTLSELGDLVPVVPPRVSELLEKGDALRRHAEEALDTVRPLPEAARELVDTLTDSVQEAVEELRAADEQYGERMQDLESAVEALSESLETWKAGVDEAVDLARPHLERVCRNAQNDGKLTVAEQESAAGLEAEASHDLEATARLQELQRGLGDAQARLASRIDAAGGALASALARLAERIEDGRAEVGDGARQLCASVTETRESLESNLETAAEAARDALTEAGDEFSRRIAHEAAARAQERLRVSCGHAASIADTMRAAVGGLEVSVGVHVGEPVGALELLLRPVDDAIGAVRSAASLVGLNLG